MLEIALERIGRRKRGAYRIEQALLPAGTELAVHAFLKDSKHPCAKEGDNQHRYTDEVELEVRRLRF